MPSPPRRRELFLESQRYFDLTRFNQPEIPAAGTAFYAGGSFASQKCLPLPDVERLLHAYGIALPRRSLEADPRVSLGAISVLIQCTASSSVSPQIPRRVRPIIPGLHAVAAGESRH